MAQEHSKNAAFHAALEKFSTDGGNLASMFQVAPNETPWGGEKLEKFTPVMAKLSQRLEKAEAEAKERPLTPEQVGKLLEQPTAPESGVSITAIEELRAQLLAQLGQLDSRNPAYTALLAKISSGSAKELSSLGSEIALAIADSYTEKAFASAEAEAEAARHAQKELLQKRQEIWQAAEKEQDNAFERATALYRQGLLPPDQYETIRQRHEAVVRGREELRQKYGDDWALNPNADTSNLKRASNDYTTSIQEAGRTTGDPQLQQQGQQLEQRDTKVAEIDHNLSRFQRRVARVDPTTAPSQISPADDQRTEGDLSHLPAPTFATANNDRAASVQPKPQGSSRA